ncbi:MAG: DUF4860 domain-containing protein [Clostridiales bacterium]|nr:DUF4860 domain-containing protein [Clostridiales bacterium]
MKKKHSVDIIFVLGLFGMFTILSVLLILVGSNIYSGIIETSERNAQIRTSLSYIVNKVHAHDKQGGVFLEVRDGVTVLVMEETYDEELYQNLIYYHEGAIKEALVNKTSNFEFSYGDKIMEVDNFEMEEKLEEELIYLSVTDAKGNSQSMRLALRSGE